MNCMQLLPSCLGEENTPDKGVVKHNTATGMMEGGIELVSTTATTDSAEEQASSEAGEEFKLLSENPVDPQEVRFVWLLE